MMINVEYLGRIFRALSTRLSDEDALAAMKSISGYLDIAPFR